MNGNLIEFNQPFTLRYALLDEDRIEIFHIR